jgi:hypothetical protein
MCAVLLMSMCGCIVCVCVWMQIHIFTVVYISNNISLFISFIRIIIMITIVILCMYALHMYV